jgi:carboxylesterase type B
MDKKPITSSKYKDVSKQVNTGKTIKDVPVLSDQFISKRKGELFKRIKPSTIVKLIEENHNTESIYNLADDINNANADNNIAINLQKEIINKKEKEKERDNHNIYDDKSVYSHQTGLTNLTQATAKTSITALTYATEMLGNLVKYFINFYLLK